ncbi:hypothetical protein K7I13_11860 [Brucepastera parasyntrophica]|uniref:hypothetical protein n=1 Tax=Brucepastera parasyntrophica TaxID=2880008 RepID=UPI00210C03B7|nr:hypothetical protein [Brucepastera parasyntrophica]ULQ59184.1 hypothetical protein K7I13_11860 [Brucepastera parasyntrophica]
MIKRTNITAIIGSICVLLTLLIFFLVPAYERTLINWLGLSFILLAEAVCTCGIIVLDRAATSSGGIMLRSGGISVLLLYAAASIFISILFQLLFRDSIRLFIILQAVIIAIAGILFLIILTAGLNTAARNEKVLNTVSEMQSLADRIAFLKNNEKNTAYKPRLEKLYESILYTDSTLPITNDGKIAGKCTELEQVFAGAGDGEESKIDSLIYEIQLLINQKVAESKAAKRGIFSYGI